MSIPKIGILDPQGINPNPFTGQPFSDAYREYAKIWTKFPMYSQVEQMVRDIQENQVLLVSAGTGSGKTTTLPKVALLAINYDGVVCVTQPKKLPALQSAQRDAAWMDVKFGEEVGVQYRGAEQGSKSSKTKLLFSTDGSVVQQLFNDPALSAYKILIVDEIHERSVNIDLILFLMKKAMRLNPSLKLILMSATIDVSLFDNYYGKEFKFKHVYVPGERMYDIDVHFIDKPLKVPEKDFVEVGITRIIDIIKSGKDGDIIFFVNSLSQAKTACDVLTNKIKEEKLNAVYCITVGSGMPRENEAALQNLEKYKMRNNRPNRRVAISTSVAESAITLKGFVFIIDSGFNYFEGFNPERMEYSLNLQRIPQSSAEQRKGRVGRTQPGVCYRLYTKEEFDKFPKYGLPTIKNADLTNVLLKFMMIPDVVDMKSLLQTINQMIEPPTKEAINSAIRNLHALGAIESKANNGNILNGHITDLGKYLLRFRKLDPPLALALLKSYAFNTEQEVAVLGVLLSEMDAAKGITTYFNPPNKFRTPEEKRRFMRGSEVRKGLKHAYGDIFVVKKIYDKFVEYKMRHNEQELRKWCYDHFFDLGELDKISRRYRETLEESRKVKAEYMQQYGNKERNNIKIYSKLENNILHPLLEGLFTNLAFNVGKVYKNCFPIVPSIADLYKDSLILQLKKQPEYMFYIVLYSFMGRTNFMVNTMVPKEVLVNLSKDKLKMVMNCIKRVNENKPSGKNIRKANNK